MGCTDAGCAMCSGYREQLVAHDACERRIATLENALRQCVVDGPPDMRGFIGKRCPLCHYCLNGRNHWYDHSDKCVIGAALKAKR